jgi:hypothetical protein
MQGYSMGSQETSVNVHKNGYEEACMQGYIKGSEETSKMVDYNG